MPDHDWSKLRPIAEKVTARCGVQFSEKHADMLRSRLTRRAMQLGLPGTVDAYAQYFSENEAEEMEELVALLTTHHTFFFREIAHFDYLENQALPALLADWKKRPDQTLRIWSAACSTGPEVYSLAMCIEGWIARHAPRLNYEILGSDVDPRSVEACQNAVYRISDLKNIPAPLLAKYWSKGTGGLEKFAKVRKILRDRCRFETRNLLELPQVRESFDIVFCRNVLIYFNPQQCETILGALKSRTSDAGYLVLGLTESQAGLNHGLTSVGASIFQKGVVKATKPAPKQKKIRVVCVDDSPTVIKLLSRIFVPDNGFEVVATAADGMEAAIVIPRHKPDLVTLDLKMPHMTGVEYLEKHFGPNHPPVLVVSSVAREEIELAQRAISLGARDYVEKPSINDVAQSKDELLQKARLIAAVPAEESAQEEHTGHSFFMSENKPGESRGAVEQSRGFGRETWFRVSGLQRDRTKRIEREALLVFELPKQGAVERFATWFSPNVSDEELSYHLDQLARQEQVDLRFGGFKILAVADSADALGKRVEGLGYRVLKSLSLTSGFIVRFERDSGKVLLEKNQAEGAAHAAARKGEKVRVFVVDDSPSIVKFLKQIIDSSSELEFAGSTTNPLEAEAKIAQLKPDVMTLDVHMPGLDGAEVLKQVLPRHRIPTVMVTSLNLEEGGKVWECLDLGAVDYIQKPSFSEIAQVKGEILEKLRLASQARVNVRSARRRVQLEGSLDIDVNRIIAIGSSTGGTEALRQILACLPDRMPPIVITQHIPPVFSKSFAEHLNEILPFDVKEAEDSDILESGSIYIAPGGKQMSIFKQGHQYKIRVTDDPPVNRFRPSVDYLFDSVAKYAAKESIGVILTGMGNDGARGLLQMRQAGSQTLAQDEASCVVYGMPRAAIELGAAEQVFSLDQIPQALVDLLKRKTRRTA